MENPPAQMALQFKVKERGLHSSTMMNPGFCMDSGYQSLHKVSITSKLSGSDNKKKLDIDYENESSAYSIFDCPQSSHGGGNRTTTKHTDENKVDDRRLRAGIE